MEDKTLKKLEDLPRALLVGLEKKWKWWEGVSKVVLRGEIEQNIDKIKNIEVSDRYTDNMIEISGKRTL